MASSGKRINSEDRRESTDRAGTIAEYTERETVLKKEKARAKSDFTRARNKLSALLEKQDLQSRRAVQDACSNMDSRLEIAMDIMISLSDLYMKHNDLEKGKKVVAEMEKLEDEYSTASEAAREHLNARWDDRSSVASDILSVDMVQKLNITDNSETYQKQAIREVNNKIKLLTFMKQCRSLPRKRHKTVTVVLTSLACLHVPMMTSHEVWPLNGHGQKAATGQSRNHAYSRGIGHHDAKVFSKQQKMKAL